MALFLPGTPTTFSLIALKGIPLMCKSDQIASLLKTSHWLPTLLRVKTKIFSMDPEALHELGPHFLSGPLTSHALTLASLLFLALASLRAFVLAILTA